MNDCIGGRKPFKHTYSKADNTKNTYNKAENYNNYEKTEKPQKKYSNKDQASEMAQGKGKVKTSNKFEGLQE